MRVVVALSLLAFAAFAAGNAYGGDEPTPAPYKPPTAAPTPKPTQAPTPRPTPPHVPPPKCPDHCNKIPRCPRCFRRVIRTRKAADGGQPCCNTYKCVPKKKCSGKPKCGKGKKAVLVRGVSVNGRRCCPKWKCVSRCIKSRHCKVHIKCKHGAKKVSVKHRACCTIYRCKGPCEGKKCRYSSTKCPKGRIPKLVRGGRTPKKPCCPKYKCVRPCKCKRLRGSCPLGWKRMSKGRRGCNCKDVWCKPPPCAKKTCNRAFIKCPKGTRKVQVRAEGKNGKPPCCCKFKCIKCGCRNKSCPIVKCNKKWQVRVKGKRTKCCQLYKCKPICKTRKPLGPKRCKKGYVRIQVRFANHKGGKPCRPKFVCRNWCRHHKRKKVCPCKSEVKCPRNWVKKQIKHNGRCCKHRWTCKPRCSYGKCKCTKKCKRGQFLVMVRGHRNSRGTRCCPKWKCISKCKKVKCRNVSHKCPRGWKRSSSKKNGRCCSHVRCRHPCAGKKCTIPKCGKYSVLYRKKRPVGYKGKRWYCCPSYGCRHQCRGVKCRKPKCGKGYVRVKQVKANKKIGRCCCQYVCKPACVAGRRIKSCNTSAKYRACKKKGRGFRVKIKKHSKFPFRPCCPRIRCIPPCTRKIRKSCKIKKCPRGWKRKLVAKRGKNGNAPCCPRHRCIPPCRGVRCKYTACPRHHVTFWTKSHDRPGKPCCRKKTCVHKCKMVKCNCIKCPKGWKKVVHKPANKKAGKCCPVKKCVPPCPPRKKLRCRKPRCKLGAVKVRGDHWPNKPCCPKYRCRNKCDGRKCRKGSNKNYKCKKAPRCKFWQNLIITGKKGSCCPRYRCRSPCKKSKYRKFKCPPGKIVARVWYGLYPKAKPCKCKKRCVCKCSLTSCPKRKCGSGYIKKVISRKNKNKGRCCNAVRCIPKCARKTCKFRCKRGTRPIVIGGARKDLKPSKKYGCCPKYRCAGPCRRRGCHTPACPAGSNPVKTGKKKGCCPVFKCQAIAYADPTIKPVQCEPIRCVRGTYPVKAGGTQWVKYTQACDIFRCKKSKAGRYAYYSKHAAKAARH